jgi:hypothetical protein
MHKLWMIGVGVISLSVACAVAQDDAAKAKNEKKADAPKVEKKAGEAKVKADAPKVEMKEMTVEGMLSKVEGKDKEGKPTTTLKMVTDDGTAVALPRMKAGDAAAVNLENHAGSRVKIIGMGTEREAKGKKSILLKSIKTIEKVGAPAAAPAV